MKRQGVCEGNERRILRFCVVVLLFLFSLALQACSGPQTNDNEGLSVSSSPPSYEGFLDSVNCDAIIAWGWDVNRPNIPIKLDIYDSNVLIAAITAEGFRQDLLSAGKGNGKHYMFYPIPVQLKDGKKHLITVKYSGTTQEVGAPKEITCNFEK